MEPPENPPRDLQTVADRAANISPIVWAMLGLAVVAAFVCALLVMPGS